MYRGKLSGDYELLWITYATRPLTTTEIFCALLHSHAVAASGFCKQAISDPTLSLCRLVVILPK